MSRSRNYIYWLGSTSKLETYSHAVNIRSKSEANNYLPRQD